jgi:hypothetical protein
LVLEGVSAEALRKILSACPVCQLLRKDEVEFLVTRVKMVSYPAGKKPTPLG